MTAKKISGIILSCISDKTSNVVAFISSILFTSTFIFCQPNSVSVIPPVGPATSFSSVTSAYASIPLAPPGNYIIELQASYTGTDASEVYPIQITDKGLLPGGFTITIRPAAGNNGETIQRTVPAVGVVLQLNGADNIVLDGRPGGITSSVANYLKVNDPFTGTTASSNIQMINGANNNIVQYINSSALVSPSAFSRNIMVGGGTASNNNNILRNNVVTGGARGIYDQGASAAIHNNSTIIQNNTINDCWEVGIFGSSNQADITIASNTITFNPGVSTTGQTFGIIQQGLAGATNITDNVIMMPSNSTTVNSLFGINLQGSSTANVLRNTITNFTAPGNASFQTTMFGIVTGGSGPVIISENTISNFSAPMGLQVFGIIVDGTQARTVTIQKNKISALSSAADNAYICGVSLTPFQGSTVNVNNNFIFLLEQNNTADSIHGIHIGYDASYYTANIYYNSIIIYGSVFGAQGGVAGTITSAGIHRTNNNPLSIYNQVNNFSVNGRWGGTPGVINTGFYNSSLNGTLNIDYNSYRGIYGPGVNAWAVALNNVQYGNSDLAAYKTASYPQEQHSNFSAYVAYVSNLDLHLQAESAIDTMLKGIPIAGLANDIDGDARSSVAPTFGADEGFTSSLCAGGGTSLIPDVSGNVYQWQVNTGSGFVNIIDNTNYTGSNAFKLQLQNIPSSWAGYQYRCMVDGVPNFVYTLKFINIWSGNINTSWENPSNWLCGSLPDLNTDVIINSGTCVLNSNVTVKSLILSPTVTYTVNPGYILTVTH